MADPDAIRIVASMQVEHVQEEGPDFRMARQGGGQILISQDKPGGGNPGTLQVTPAWEEINFGELDVLGWCRMNNNSDVYTVQLGVEDGGGNQIPYGRMKPGEPQLIRLDPDATYWIRIHPSSFPVGSGSGSGSASDIARVLVQAIED